MQITIVQSEIEAAIRKYIQEQIVVRDGMKIEIDLRATRGDAGFMATIDIVPENTAAKPRTEPPPAPAPRATVATTTKPAATQSAPAPESAEALVVEADPAPAQVDEPATTAETMAEAPAPAPAPKSLFANLKKPVNS